MRVSCRVRVTAEEVQALRNLLGLAYCEPILANTPPLRALLDRLTEDVLVDDSREDLIEEARAVYQNEDCEIDEDAPFSDADGGTWVGAWVWVPEPEDETEDGIEVTELGAE